MRLAAISDIHGNLGALEAVLDDVGRNHVDQIVNLGDVLSGPFDPVGTAERLVPLGLPTVKGNHDENVVEKALTKMGGTDRHARERLDEAVLNWLRGLPLTLEIENEICLCHGSPRSNRYFWLDGPGKTPDMVPRDVKKVRKQVEGIAHSLILCGHTHMPHMVDLGDGRLVVNPGSVGNPAYFDRDPEMRFAAGSPHARYAIIEKQNSGWRADFRAVPYDHAAAARQARENGFEEWAFWTETGRWN
ncbi:MAG: metallophosphoesterase family protein [Hyphomicrobiaceae bacterium]|nr:metallophosphoesterase family protein [Hyphomicrobiaceae bacterium]